MKTDCKYMQRALELAERGRGFVNPNPLVGAVIVREDRIIGEGWHKRYGDWHAERNAIGAATEELAGSTMYVTLEPCCHQGKTPPCTEAILEAGISRVVVAMEDPNPLVAGRGVELLRSAGVEVEVGVEAEKAREQNRVFLKWIATGLPWVTMKTAMTLDGKIATRTGDSKWITGEPARELVHRMRAERMAVMVGIGTLLADDPVLNVRLTDRDYRQPVRVVVDSNARLPLDCRLVMTATQYRTLVVHTRFVMEGKIEALKAWGVETVLCRDLQGQVDPGDLMQQMADRGIDSVLLEGGGTLNFSFLSAGLVDEVYAFIAPKIIGGSQAKTPVEGKGLELMSEAILLNCPEVSTVGEDVLVYGKIAGK